DPLADARIRPLLERYCRLAGVKQAALGPDHAELSLPKSERSFFRDRASLRLAFSLDALERDPDAEIAVLGSPFLSQLIEAIRARAARLSLELIAPPATAASDPGGVELTIPVRDGTVTRGATKVALHPVGRLVARVVLRAGAGVGRLDRYFESILKEQSDPEGIASVTALAERRRTEEIRRSQVKAVVHPLQLIDAAVLIQRAEWQLESSRGRRATFSAQRSLSGVSAWLLACPHCGRPPATLVVCRHEHCACDACSHRCSVCAEDFCADHGIAECRVDAQPACDEHVRVCPSCRLEHCTAHEGVCAEGEGHTACSACLAPCGSCGRVVCTRH